MNFHEHPFLSFGRAFIAFFLFLFDLVFLGPEGAGWGWLPSFLVAALFGLFYAYGSKKWSVLLSIIFLLLVTYITPYAKPYFAENGVNIETIGSLISSVAMIVAIIGIPIFLFWAWCKNREIINKRKFENEQAGRICCPRCGSARVHYKEIQDVWKCTDCKHEWSDDNFLF